MVEYVEVTSPSSAPPRPAAFTATAELVERLTGNVASVIRGKHDAIRLSLVAMLSGHHLLLEDVPGVGKTLLAKAIARSVDGSFRRIQGTPDLLPAEMTGVSVYHRERGDWEFRPGPIFANVVLVDEINRATPRSQSALLEAMEEVQVTVDGETWPLPKPFFVVATQNPVEQVGTFPLVEGQRDRFGLIVELGHPPRAAERELLLGTGGTDSLDAVRPVCTTQDLGAAIAAIRGVFCTPALADYVIDVVSATRSHRDIVLGASARASLSLLHAAKAYAAMSGRHFVVPDDVQAVAAAVLSHRIILAGGTDLHASIALVRRLLETTPVPRG